MLSLLAVAACDKAKPPAEQANAAAPADATANAAATGIGEGESAVDRSHKGLALPAMPFEAPGGGPQTFGQWRGKPVLVNFWATWCAPCVRELPTLDALAARGTIPVVAVSEDTGGAARVGPFWKAKGLKALVPYTDAKMRLMTALQIEVLPTTILYGADGKEVLRVVGGKDWTGPEAAKLIAEAK